MGGKESIRGYVLQAIISLLKSLDDEWTFLYLEPDSANQKIDIKWKQPNDAVIVEQVKSSIRNFSKTNIIDWIIDLYNDYSSAQRFRLTLIGNYSDETSKFFENLDKLSKDSPDSKISELYAIRDRLEISIFPLKTEILKSDVTVKLYKFLEGNNILTKLSDANVAVNALLFDTLIDSIKNKEISRKEFENHILSVFDSFENHLVSSKKEISPCFYLEEIGEFNKSIIASSLIKLEELQVINDLKQKLISSIEEIDKIKLHRKEFSLIESIDEPLGEYLETNISIAVKSILNTDLSEGFFHFGDLRRVMKTDGLFLPGRSLYKYEGNEQEIQKWDLFSDFWWQLDTIKDLLSYIYKINNYYYLSLALCNTGNEFDSELRIRLKIPKIVKVLNSENFPIPDSLETLKLLCNNQSPLITALKINKDSNLKESFSSQLFPEYLDLIGMDIFPNKEKDKEELQGNFKRLISYIFDFEIFCDQKEYNIIDFKISQINPAESFGLVSYLFIDSDSAFDIKYEITSKTNYKNEGVLQVELPAANTRS